MSGKKMKKYRKWLALSMVVLLGVSLLPAGAYAQAPDKGGTKPANGANGTQVSGADMAGIDELVGILMQKGVLKKDDVAALMQKKGEPGFSPLAVLTELLKTKGVLTQDEAQKVAKKSESAAGKPVTLYYTRDPKDVEKITQAVTSEIRKDFSERVKAEIKQEVIQETQKEIQSAAAPEWTKRIRFGGDMRLRYAGDYFDANNASFVKPSDPTQILNSTEDRNRFRVRARLGATADIDERLEAGVRLTTGDTTNPVTTNQTMGTYGNKYSVVFDLAYLKVKPFHGLTILGGRLPNPFFFTDLVWYRDLTFDGFAANYRGRFADMLEPFATAGAFPLQEVELSSKDKWLFAGQVGEDCGQ